MTPRARLLELLKNATPRPWTAERISEAESAIYAPDGDRIALVVDLIGSSEYGANAELIAAAVNALPELCAKLDAAEAEVARLKTENSALRCELVKAVDENGSLRAVLGLVETWTHEHAAALCPTPGSADTFGDGMRKAKRQVGNILGKALGTEGGGE